MSSYTYEQTLIANQGDGAALTNTVTATSLLPAQAKFTIPANFLANVGQKLRIKASGRVSTLVTSPGTLTLDVRLGASTVIFNGGAMNLNIVAQTNATWLYEAILDLRAIGASTAAQFLGVGEWKSRAIIGAVAVASGGVPVTPLPDTAPAVGTGFDSTVANVLDFFATWSVANAANSITLHQFSLEAMN